MSIYLDHNATTPVDPAVLEAMLPFLRDDFANASSVHSPGQRARAAVDQARESVAALIGARPSEIVFTSGGTEADNLAILGVIKASNAANKHVISTLIEHHAVLQTCQALEKEGVAVTYIAPDASGIISPDSLRRALRAETVLVSVMHANNELGTIQPVEEIGRIAQEGQIPFHVDAVQSAGKLPIDVREIGADLLSLSAHKFYGPKGVGALYVRSGSSIEPIFRGGQHERGLRPGTENVPGIVGMGKAAELARQHLAEDSARIAALRDRFESAMYESVPGIRTNGESARRVCNTTNITVPGASGESLVIALDLQGIACSTGAACSSGAIEPSHVLLAIGLGDDEARSSVRFSLGRTTTAAEIDHAIALIPPVVERLRALSPRFPAMAPAAAGRAS
ncbi:MAG TPA: cysteine desulfurase family protein [Candidatus Acidoferrales bacterium]|nr:cysteine desulfurase family protein [Candidatus Acidoferrales bacterium]